MILRRSGVLGAAGAIVMSLWPAAGHAQSAPEDPTVGYRMEATSTYVIDPPGRAIHVGIDVALTNETPDDFGAYYVSRSYLDSFAVPIVAEATNLAATRPDGRPLAVSVEPIEGSPLAVAVVDLSPDLYYGDTQSVRLAFDLPDQPPRSAGLTRANPAYIAVLPFALGDPGLANVSVVVPDGYEVEVVGANRLDLLDGQDGYVANAIADPLLWDASLVARDDDQLRVVDANVGGHRIRVLAWPDDVEWSEFVAQQLRDGLPVLEELVGRPWPVRDQLHVQETSTPYLYGYAGWYDDLLDTIEIGDDLDPHVILHETSHAWFNDELFAERWINEGFAEEMAARTLERLGQPLIGPDPIAPDDPGAVRLLDWSSPNLSAEISEEQERYGYNTSFLVIRSLVDEVGLEAVGRVIDAAADDRLAYQGDPEPEASVRTTSWRRFLDLVEELGGSTSAVGLFSTYVVDEAGAAELAAREPARAAYAQLQELGVTWTPPLAVREAMAEWRFADATAEMTAASALLATRDGITATVEPLGLEVPASLEDDFESASDLDDVATAADALDDAAGRLVEADASVHADHGLLASIGLLSGAADDALDDAEASFAAGDADGASEAADHAIALVDDAAAAGARRAGLVLVGLALVGLYVWLLLRWRSRRTVSEPAIPS